MAQIWDTHELDIIWDTHELDIIWDTHELDHELGQSKDIIWDTHDSFHGVNQRGQTRSNQWGQTRLI